MLPRNLLTQWARLLLEGLAEAGVIDVVISPGSRSTPFAAAALRASALTCHSVVDERSAGFFALGMAKVSGRPTLLLCTSGSAPAHYYPAVIEASESRIPLLVLSADRPFELLECGAPQTIDQAQLFGRHVRWFADLGTPEASRLGLAALRRKASQAVLATRWPLPGPVHLNAHAAKPLEPVTLAALRDVTTEERALEAQVDELLRAPAPRPHVAPAVPPPSGLDLLLERLKSCRRGLIVAGRRELWHARDAARGASAHAGADAPSRALLPAPAPGPLLLAERSGLPLILEAPSQLRLRAGEPEAVVLDALDALVRVAWPAEESVASALELPDFVLELGPPLTSSAWQTLATRLPPGVRHVVAEAPWPDPANNLAELVIADPWAVADELARRLRALSDPERGEALELATNTEVRGAWTRRLGEYNRLAWRDIDRALAAGVPGAMEGALAEPLAVRTLVEALPAGALLAVGNSLPIREIDWVCPRGVADVHVSVQRGANGIDGLIAGACGAAHASHRPTCLLLGDVSALHDVGSLTLAREVAVPLLIAVLDNGGGRIFGMLPFARQAEHLAEVWRFWATPPRIDFAAAAQTFGLRYARCRDARELRGVVTSVLGPGAQRGATLLHVEVATGSAQHFLANLPEIPLKQLKP
jgi:2-succinyl-5-enolpyruvyl-6-hydroxy-3-cyclohexene-1-carboxylate synthase